MNLKSVGLILIYISIMAMPVKSQVYNNISKPADLVIDSNFRIYPSNVIQSETFIVTHPTNQNIMFASAYTIVTNPFFLSEGVYITTDGGSSWYGSDTCNGAPIQFHGGEPAITIDKNGTFIINRLGRLPTFLGLYSHYSTDNGITWSNQKTITTDDLEKHSIATDNNTISSYYGRTYAIYSMLTTPFRIKFSISDDGAQNWSTPQNLNNPPIRCYGTDMDIDKNGNVLACWAVIPTGVPSPYEVSIGFARSVNGGGSWSVSENAISVRGITGILNQKQNIRVNSIPRIAVDNTDGPFGGTIYIVTSQKELAPAGNDPDIVLFKSTDNGNSWSGGIRVNQDSFNNGKIQFFPAILIDPSGAINVLYLDDRNTTSDSTGVFLSRSTDGGETWTDYQVSDHNFRPTAVSGIGAGNISDHIDMTYSNGKLWPVWMDNSTGVYQIWTAPITLPPVSVDAEETSITNFVLYQNYPNPFNPTTKISWQSPTGGWQRLKVFDMLGKEIVTLVDEYKQAGTYEIQFNANDISDRKKLTSGIYFYRLEINEFSETRSMILLK